MYGVNEAKAGIEIGSGRAIQSIAQGPSSPPVTRGSVDLYLTDLNEQIQGAHQRLSALATRLDPILRPAGPTGDGGPRNEEMASPCAESLRAHAAAMSGLCSRLNDLIDRVDL